MIATAKQLALGNTSLMTQLAIMSNMEACDWKETSQVLTEKWGKVVRPFRVKSGHWSLIMVLKKTVKFWSITQSNIMTDCTHVKCESISYV